MENRKNNQPLDLAVTDPEWTAITTAFAGQEVPAARCGSSASALPR